MIEKETYTQNHILLLNDAAGFETLIHELNKEKYKLTQIKNIDDALPLSSQGNFDLILILLSNENEKNNYFVGELKKQYSTNQLPVLMILKEKNKKIIIDAYKAGVCGHIVEPIDFDIFHLYLKAILRRKTADDNLKKENKYLESEKEKLEYQKTQAQKLEAIGQLAAGIAHEINTPIQYIGDNINFLENSFYDLQKLHKKIQDLLHDLLNKKAKFKTVKDINILMKEIDFEFIEEEIPKAIKQSIEGVSQVAKIVRSMKEFSHPGSKEKKYQNINKALENTLNVSRNEWKYVADIEKIFDDSISEILCLPGELNQAFLNLILNAAQAIQEELTKTGSKEKGKIIISTEKQNKDIVIKISDTGCGILEENRNKIFNPFFTTKEEGKGTGQGLAIVHNVITEKHDGSIDFESELNKGTTFIIRLPCESSVENIST
ncbi:MAG: ATP-binding protein [Spirochaetia bacterium]|nr:ATP-binding protein [Spirochaetia bacterium]